jgi:hypothetical protein
MLLVERTPRAGGTAIKTTYPGGHGIDWDFEPHGLLSWIDRGDDVQRARTAGEARFAEARADVAAMAWAERTADFLLRRLHEPAPIDLEMDR